MGREERLIKTEEGKVGDLVKASALPATFPNLLTLSHADAANL